MSSGLSKATVDRHQRLVLELLKQPGNDVCADCRTRNPRWASWNLGIFICVKCAGIHRKMGTHITKVKSLTLDSWTKEQVESMKSKGNLKANSQWNPNEAKNPPPTDLEESERDSELEKFIPSLSPRTSSTGGRPTQSTLSPSLNTSGIQQTSLTQTQIIDAQYARSPSSIQTQFAHSVPPHRPATAPIPNAVKPQPAPPVPPLPISMSNSSTPNGSSFHPSIESATSHALTYPLLQANHSAVSNTPTIRRHGVWDDLLQLSNPTGSVSNNGTAPYLSTGPSMQASITPAWSTSATPSNFQSISSYTNSQTPSMMHPMSSTLTPSTFNTIGKPVLPNENPFYNQAAPQQSSHQPMSTSPNLAATNALNMSNFLPGNMTTSVIPTNPFFNPTPTLQSSSISGVPSKNPFATAAIAPPNNAFQPNGAFASNSMQFIPTHQQQQPQPQQMQNPPPANFSFNNPYAPTPFPHRQTQHQPSPFGPSLI
ncbi:hypothetical protein CROQUDRAFT_544186 [Cronartium quercuum f. sp. fusiforme G11]|uniref:Arf-GAP domain-containing protein n=1 Tax=Cronartium quercuum f. sp. fusiforme G11 TaxID=708437 RepID=A0A9P6NQE4_9BASI|nr:hypothetical protein CROQUDRAFT_544186 [Cronartium quercuum f. sp. fusiforme G11]